MELSRMQVVLGRYLRLLLYLAFFAHTSKGLSREPFGGSSFINFKSDEFSYLNITNIGWSLIEDGRECGFACLEIPSCLSYNLASSTNRDVNNKLLCELLPSDKYNNSDKFITTPLFHHFNIPSPCISWPCQNNGTCVSRYENNSYACVCPKKYKGKFCQTVAIRCENNTCLNNGTCIDGPNGFNCRCPPGYNGNRCGTGLEKSNILSEHGGSLYIQDLSRLLSPTLHTFSSKWERCWRAQIDGWTASAFHGNCDYKDQTVTIVRVGSYIFGGYTSINWTRNCGYQYDNKAFIFSLYAPTGYNITKLKPLRYPQSAIYTCSTTGPTFGGGHDLHIRDGGQDSYTYASSYDPPPGCTYGSYCPFFTGKNKFNASDVEVFYEK